MVLYKYINFILIINNKYMFNIMENYKQLFCLCVKNEFSGGENPSIPDEANTEPNPFDGDSLSDFKRLQSLVNDWDINSKDAKEIVANFEDISDEAKLWVKAIVENMIEEGFTAKDVSTYNSYKSLIEKTWVKLMDWAEIQDKIVESLKLMDIPIGWFDLTLEWFDLKNLNWISLINKDGSISVKYDKGWFMDTLTIDAATGETKWSSEDGEHEKVNKNEIKKDLFDETVNELEANKEKPQKPEPTVETVENNSEKLNSAKSYYKSMWATPANIEGLQASLLLNWEELPKFWVDWDFWKEAFDAIVSYQTKNNLTPDWKAGTNTLRALKLIWEAETSKDFYWVIEEPVEPVEPVEPSITDSISENFERWLAWIDETFTWNEDLTKFIWKNWEEIVVEFDKSEHELSIDTAFFDWVEDYKVDKKISSKLDDSKIAKLENADQARDYIKDALADLEKDYNDKALKAAVWEKDYSDAEYDQEEIVIDREDGLDIDDIGWDTIIKGVPEGKQGELVKFYKQSGLSLIDFKSMFAEWHSYEQLRKENTFKNDEKKSDYVKWIFKDEFGNNEFTVTKNKETGLINIDWGIMDIWGLNIKNMPYNDEVAIAKVVAWYNTSMKSKIDFTWGTVDYKEIQSELYEL